MFKNLYIDNWLSDTLNKYKNTYHSAIKMKPINIKSSTYIDFGEENNKADPKFEVGYNQIGEKILWLKKLKIFSHGHIILVILAGRIL